MTVKKSIVILGGSYAGVSIAHYILQHTFPRFPDQEAYEIVIVSSSSEALCRPACPRALLSDDMFPQRKLFVSIPAAFSRYPAGWFRFVKGTATNLDHVNRTVTIRNGSGSTHTMRYYALVIATGASTPSPLQGLTEDEEFLKASWAEFRKALPYAKSIVIAGGGPTGIETAGELGGYLNSQGGAFSSRSAEPKVSITVLNDSSKILPVLRPAIAAKAEKLLAKVGVQVWNNTRVRSVEPPDAGTSRPTANATIFLEDGRSLDADLYIPCYGTTPNTNFIDRSLLAPDGRVETNPETLRVDKAGPLVYAAGDVATCSRPAIHTIMAAIPILGGNMKRDLLHAAGLLNVVPIEDRTYKEDTSETQMVPIGRSRGVGAAMGFSLPGWLVWVIKGRDYWLWTTGSLWNGKQWANSEL